MRYRKNSMALCRTCALIALAGSLCLVSAASPGVTDKGIVFGQTACFTGPNGHLGVRYRAGIQAAFEERNKQGGINGRKLELIALDDGYEPVLAAENAERFVAQDDVLAVIGGVGTPTAKRVAPILRDAKIPLVGLFSGAAFLRDFKKFPNIVNLRASYPEEIELLVDYMVNELGKRRFGVIFQDDAFGRSALANYHHALGRHDLPILAKSSFSRNTHAVHSSLFTLAKADLDAVLIVGSYAANADVINLADSLNQGYVMANLSFVGSHDLMEVVDSASEEFLERILVAEVVPDPKDPDSKLVKSFLEAIEGAEESYAMHEGLLGLRGAHFTDAVSLEGYIVGRFVLNVLGRIEGGPTRERLLATALQPQPVHIDDWTIQIAAGTNTGSHYVRLINLAGDHLADGEPQ